MWIKIIDPADSNSDNWLGTLEKQNDFNGKWQFEIIRSHDGLVDAYKSINDFSSLDTLVGLLDFQKPCTLVYPMVNNMDPGTIGINYSEHRTVLKGRCSLIIENVQIFDLDQPKIEAVTISSDSCVSWLSKLERPNNKDDMSTLQKKEFSIPDFGTVVCKYGTSNSYYTWEDKQSSIGNISINFLNKISTREAISWCNELELLFQFLIGHSTKWSKFGLKLDETYELDNKISNIFCSLEFGNSPHKENDKLHPAECRYVDNQNCSFTEKVLEKYHDNRELLSDLISTIWVCENISKTLQDKLAFLLPVFESYLNRSFIESHEKEYLKFEQNFFKYVEESCDENITEFSRKHLKVINKKSASFKVLIERSINKINSLGFSVDNDYAKRIAKRRSEIFHKALELKNNDDVRNMYQEYVIVLGLLTLHTYVELGVEITKFRNIGFNGGIIHELIGLETN